MAEHATTASSLGEESKIEVDSAAMAPVETVKTEPALLAVPSTVEEASEEAKPDLTTEENGEEEKKIAAMRQIEFYFADSNLPFDKFMWTLYSSSPEHWVPVSTVASFKRMRQYQALGPEWIVSALRISDELEVSEDGTKVRRRTEVKPPKGQFERSIYAKGFGDEVDGLQKELETLFEKYGRTNAVRMRRDEKKKFKGSVFVEFADSKSVDVFLKADPKPSWKGEELLIMTKEAYCEMKIKEKGLTGKAASNRKQSQGSTKGFNAFREMEIAAARAKKAAKAGEEKEKEKEKEAKKPVIMMEFMGNRIAVQEGKDGGSVKPDDVPFIKGASLQFEGAGESMSFDQIKSPLKERFTRVPYVKHTRGETSGLVGFDKALTEDELSYVKEHLKTLGDQEVSWTVPDEETERDFQLERAQSAARRAIHFSQSNQGSGRGRGGRGGARGRGGRGGRGGGRRRGRANDSERNENGTATATSAEEQAGEKRKRAVEPDGGPDVGVRGQAVPLIQSSKKVKTEEAE